MVSLVVAVYNEEGRLRGRYPRMREFLESLGEPWELIFVDDGSRDGTLALLRELAAQEPRVRVAGLIENHGQGAAVKLGMLASRGDVVLYTDADLSVPLEFARKLVEAVRAGADMAVASRWMYGARIGAPQPAARRVLGKAYYALIHALIVADIHDTNCGLKAYRGEAARTLFGFVRSWRWVFNVEHIWLARRWGLKVVELPAEWSHREDSKVHVFRDGAFTLWELFGLQARRFFGIYPLIRPR